MRARPVALALLLAAAGCGRADGPLVVGAVYPTGGEQGPGGVEEARGLRLAAELVNERGGVRGRPVRIRLLPADRAEAAPGAVERLAASGAALIAGSYGSTISQPAAVTAARLGLPYWETGAVGEMDAAAKPGRLTFRFPPTGGTLGRAAVRFMEETLLPRLDEDPGLRYGVTFADDVYGRTVAEGALAELRDRDLPLAGRFPYDPRTVDPGRLARRIGRAGTDVLVVVAYLEDGVALRRALLRHDVSLAASIGTSSAYCHPEFGAILGDDAVGLFASDKPDADYVREDRLTADAAEILAWGRREFAERFGEPMSAAALSGFSAGWALFRHVLPSAASDAAEDVAAAALDLRLPQGSLPNASGLHLAGGGHPEPGANLAAASVVWQWVAPRVRAVVWPPELAEERLVPMSLR
jgi:branched-chain amino acid transport system substrate-binding protein